MAVSTSCLNRIQLANPMHQLQAERMQQHGQQHRHAAQPPRFGARSSSSVFSGRPVSSSVINSAGSAMHTTWLMNNQQREEAKVGRLPARCAEIAKLREKLHHENQRHAEKRLGQRRRVLPIAHQVHEPPPQIEPLALAEQHRFLVELIHGPANRQRQQTSVTTHTGTT